MMDLSMRMARRTGAVLALAFVMGVPGVALATGSGYDRDGFISALTPVTGDEDARKVDLYLTFALGSADLAPQARAQLGELAAALSSAELAQARFGIYGHTDATGSADLNMALSARRAEAVRAYLVGLGVAPARLDSEGYGESRLKNLINPNAAENRRVEIVNLTPPKPSTSGMMPITGDAPE